MAIHDLIRPLGEGFRRAFPPILAGVLFLMAWEFAIWYFSLPNFVLPRPGEIVIAAADNPHALLDDTLATLLEAVGGYVVGGLLGVGLAILFVALPIAERLVLPVYVTLNSVPTIAYGPLAIIWFGIGSMSKIVLILISVSYIVLINALAGFEAATPVPWSCSGLWSTRKDIFRTLRIPSAMPWIFAGLRVAVV